MPFMVGLLYLFAVSSGLFGGREEDSGSHTYYAISADGACTFDRGVITYYTGHCSYSPAYVYTRDVITKFDGKDIWVVDVFDDDLDQESPQSTMDLPPPPKGFSKIDPPN